MILHRLILLLTLGCSFSSPLFSGAERGGHLITEAGGAQGVAGVAGPAGAPGLAGAAGAAGVPGIPGIPGAPGILDFADFYSLQGGAFTDNSPPVAAGGASSATRGVESRTRRTHPSDSGARGSFAATSIEN